MMAASVAFVTEARLSGAAAPHKMNAAVMIRAGQNTAVSMPRNLLVVDMRDLPNQFRNQFLKNSPWTSKTPTSCETRVADGAR